MSQLASKIRGLDEILMGGFSPASIVLIEGLPGTGKTILASELAVRAAKDLGAKTLYLTFESSEQSFSANAESFGWSRDGVVFVETSADKLAENLEESLFQLIKQENFDRLVIDNLTPLRLHFEDQTPRVYRDFLSRLFRTLRDLRVLSFIVTETEPSRVLGETGAGPEHFLADTVLTLRKEEQRRSLLRSIEIAKSRGQRVLQGRHSFAIRDERGFEVYPRAYSRDRVQNKAAMTNTLENFGITGLDEMLGGGIYQGSSTLTVGISGTGKTIMAMQFLNEALERGENVLLVTLDDTTGQFCRNAAQIGFKFTEALEDGRLTLLHEIPLEIDLDRHFSEIEDVLRSKKISRVVVDSVATYEMILPKESHEFLLALNTLLKNYGATSLLAYECPELLGISQITGRIRVSALADNIILLNYVEISTTLRRAVTVPKARGSSPERQTREYVIKTGGLTLLDESTVPASDKVPQLPLSCYYGVLARSPTRHSPIIDESVAAGKPMPKSKIPRPIKNVN